MELVPFADLYLVAAPGAVMTPRPATEGIVTAAVTHIGGRQARVADVGTGSGAIALAVASACPTADVWATDTSVSAVEVARLNARRLGLAERVRVEHCDLLGPAPGRFDVVAANLPYLPASLASERPELAGEPHDALFAPGDGLEPYRRLVDAAEPVLAEDGVLLLQLHRELITARREELPALRLALAA